MDQTREPIFNVPVVVVGLVAFLLLVHAFAESLVGPTVLIWDFSFIPARYAFVLGIDPLAEISARAAAEPGLAGERAVAVARLLAVEGDPKWWTLLTYAFLHGSWAHVLLNSVWLFAFGAAVARRFGTVRFLVLFVLSAVGGAVAHFATNVTDVTPMVGASASVSGAMAAAMRFAFQPGAPLGVFRYDERLAYVLPALPLRDVLAERRVLTFLLVWLGLNILTGVGASQLGLIDSAIAWQAHIGGFLVGLLAFPLLDPVPAGPR